MTSPFLFADWPAPAKVRAFTTLRHGAGVSDAPFDHFNMGLRSGDEEQAVRCNRALLVEQGELPAPPQWLQQVHGIDVWRFEGATAQCIGAESIGHDSGATGDADAFPQGDAAVTATPGQVLAILTADCLPALFCARDGSEVAAAHAGWRGLAAGVLERTVAAMRAPPAEVLAWLGPAAGPQHYEIGEEVHAAFLDRDPAAAMSFVATRPGHWRVDLPALARRRLQQAGIPAAQIHGGDLCTIADPTRFFSHRRDQRTGRMASLIWIDPSAP